MRHTSAPGNSPSATALLIDALATYRGTKLIIDDYLTEPLREKAYEEFNRLPPALKDKAVYLLGCPWCVSIWVAGFLTLLRFKAPALAHILSTTLAASAVTGILYTKVD